VIIFFNKTTAKIAFYLSPFVLRDRLIDTVTKVAV